MEDFNTSDNTMSFSGASPPTYSQQMIDQSAPLLPPALVVFLVFPAIEMNN
jgi:hypothetical protein